MQQQELTNVISEEYKQEGSEPPVIKLPTAEKKFSLSLSKVFHDLSFWLLLVSNVIAIYFINKNDVAVQSVLLIYWAQSVTIGVVNVARILLLKNFSTKDVRVNGRPIEAVASAKLFIAGFFAVHYGLFHLGYLMFILGQGIVPVDWAGVLSIASAFFLSHVFSFLYNFKQETEGRNIGKVMFAPYARIIPMHIAIIFGAFSPVFLLNILLVLKAAVDLVAHAFKHKDAPADNIA